MCGEASSEGLEEEEEVLVVGQLALSGRRAQDTSTEVTVFKVQYGSF